MKERFRRFVRVLWLGYLFLRHPRKAYSLMGLIRGPDGWGESLKNVFTCRLRGFFFPFNLIQGLVRITPLTGRPAIYELYTELRDLGWGVRQGRRSGLDVEHYLSHAVHATRVLLSLPLQTKEEKIEIQALYKLAKLLQGGAPRFTLLTERQLLNWINERPS